VQCEDAYAPSQHFTGRVWKEREAMPRPYDGPIGSPAIGNCGASNNQLSIRIGSCRMRTPIA